MEVRILAVSAFLLVAATPAAASDIVEALSMATEFMGDTVKDGFEELDVDDGDEALLLILAGDPSALGHSPTPSPFETLGKTRLAYSDLAPLIERAAAQTGLPAALIDAVIRTESGYRPRAVSRAGAKGLMQLMPGTARDVGVRDPFDPEQNIMGGARYLRRMFDRYGSLRLAVAAYNAGPGNVDKHEGVPPFRETRRYVAVVMQRYQRARLGGLR